MGNSIEPPAPMAGTEAPVTKKWCYTHLKVAKIRYIWTISNFSFFDRNGELRSSTFSPDGDANLKFCLTLSSDERWGQTDTENYVSIFLLLLSSDKSVAVKSVAISILNSKRGQVKSEEFCRPRRFVQGTIWGCTEFDKRDFLLNEATGLLPQDTLTISCDASIAVDTVNISVQNTIIQYKAPISKLSEDFGNLFDNVSLSDVTLAVGEREFQVHKAILAARSPVFCAMFGHKMKESEQNRVAITDFDPDVIEEMLHFIYTGSAPNLEQMADVLLGAADKYSLDNLKLMCEEALYENLSAENANDTIILADRYCSVQLKAQTIDFIKTRAPITKEWCYTEVNVEKFRYIWRIRNFSFWCMNEELKSSIFSHTNSNLEFCLQMNGESKLTDEKSENYVSIELSLVSSDKKEVAVKYKCSILNARCEETNSSLSEGVRSLLLGDKCGFPKFVEHAVLLDEANGLLPQDTLSILCEGSIVGDTLNISSRNKIIQNKIPDPKLSEDFGNLFDNKRLSDVTLVVGERDFQVHQIILAARSSVFAAMFEHKVNESVENRVTITDTDPDIIEEILRFIYTGTALNLKTNSSDLLAAADKYALENLKVMCEEVLYDNLTVENASDTLILADRYCADQLKAQTIDFLKTHATYVVETSGWKNLIGTNSLLAEEVRLVYESTKQ